MCETTVNIVYKTSKITVSYQHIASIYRRNLVLNPAPFPDTNSCLVRTGNSQLNIQYKLTSSIQTRTDLLEDVFSDQRYIWTLKRYSC